MKKVKISVVIPAYNEEKYIAKTLKSLMNQDFPRELFEVIVVNNGSTDKTHQVAEKFDVKVIRYNKVQGVSAARDVGSKMAEGEIIAGTDADTVVPKYWLKTIESNLRAGDVVGVSGPVGIAGGTILQRLSYFLGFEFYRVIEAITKKVYFTGMNFAIKKEVFDKIGGFRVSLVAGEDLDLSLRAVKYGKIVYDTRLKTMTDPRRLREGSLKSFWRYVVTFLAVRYNKSIPGFSNYR